MENLTATQGTGLLVSLSAAITMAWPVVKPLLQSALASWSKSGKAKTLAHVSQFLDFRVTLDEQTDKSAWEQMRPPKEVKQ